MDLIQHDRFKLKTEDWGLIDYQTSVDRQLKLVDRIAEGQATETVVFCSHPPVVTLGRATSAEDLMGWSGSTVESSRGGRATYHGPNQMVIYPLIDLRIRRAELPERDVHSYLRVLETATVTALQSIGLSKAEARTTKAGDISLTGVWLGEQKIASIGIAVRKWITYHGIAINIENDPNAFQGIRPCGFSPNVMTSVQSQLSGDSTNVLREHLQASFTAALSKMIRPI